MILTEKAVHGLATFYTFCELVTSSLPSCHLYLPGSQSLYLCKLKIMEGGAFLHCSKVKELD